MNYRGPLLALAILGMGIVSLLQSAVGPQIALLGVRPDLILVIVLAWTLVYGPREGVVMAFAGGIWLDLFSGGLMGASSLALIAAVLPAGSGYTTLFRTHLAVPLATGVVGTLVFSVVYLSILFLVGQTSLFLTMMTRLVPPAIFYNTVLLLAVSPLLNRIPEARGVG